MTGFVSVLTGTMGRISAGDRPSQADRVEPILGEKLTALTGSLSERISLTCHGAELIPTVGFSYGTAPGRCGLLIC